MAVLTTQQRKEVTDEIVRSKDPLWGTCAGIKADVAAVVAAADDFQDANAAAFNTSIPAGPRAAMTSTQKSIIFSAVAKKRYGG